MADQCEMIIGYLVPHRCENPALGKCIQCGRGFCEEHMNQTPQGWLCLADEQGLAQPVMLPLTAATFSTHDMELFERASAWEAEDRADLFSDLS